MKRMLLLVALFLLGTGALSAGAYPRNSLTVEPLGLYFGIANVEFEHVYERQMAYAFRANYVDSTDPDWTGNGVGWVPACASSPSLTCARPKGSGSDLRRTPPPPPSPTTGKPPRPWPGAWGAILGWNTGVSIRHCGGKRG